MDQQTAPIIRDLFPMLNREKLSEAEANLDQYLALALRIYERVIADPASYAQFRTLTVRTGTVR